MDGVRVDNAVVDIVAAGYGKIDGTRVDGARVGNGTGNDDGPKAAKAIKIDIVTSKSKILIPVSS